MYCIPKKILQKCYSENNIKTYTIYDKIRSYLPLKEINENPVLSSALTQEKKIVFNLLTSNKSKMISTKGLKSEKKLRLVDRINSFRKSYYNYFKKYKYSMDEITTLSKYNALFMKKYHQIEERKSIKNKEPFEEIKKEYEKKNYNLPTIEGNKNLLGGSLLLSNNDTDLKKYIMYGVGTLNSNFKSISYLNKVNQDIYEKTQREGKRTKLPIGLVKGNRGRRGGIIVPSPIFAFYKKANIHMKDIWEYQNEINKVKNTIDSIPEIDYFFDSDNQTYLDSLKFYDSRKSSANYSTGVYLDKSTGNNNSSFCSKKEFNGSNSSSLHNIGGITYNGAQTTKNNIKKININQNPNITNSFSDKNLEIKEQILNSDIPNLTQTSKISKKKKKSTIVNMKNQVKMLETLYKQVSTSFDTIPYNQKIEKYLKCRKYDILPKLSPNNICNNFENIREKICKGKVMRRMIELRKNLDNNKSSIEQINKNEQKTKKNMNENEDKMIKVFSGFQK